MRALWYGLAYVVPLSAFAGIAAGGAGVWAAPLVAFILTPVLDALFGHDVENPVPGEARGRRLAYDLWLWAFVPLQLALIGYALARATSPEWTLVERIGAAVAVGVVTGGGGITIAHELIHRPDRFSRALGELLMVLVTYPQFVVEHVLGHHKNVATPIDPASARRGETLYQFLPRTLVGSAKSAWHLEGRRVARAGVRPWSFADRRLRLAAATVAAYVVVGGLFGAAGAAFFALQSVVAILLLETVNYVEHYGLTRHRLHDGRFERVRDEHSWNSPHRLTGFYLFSLPRHADHHAHAARPYWALRHVEDAPALPAGYPTMILLALAPPLWFRVMDKRVDAWRAQRVAAPARLRVAA